MFLCRISALDLHFLHFTPESISVTRAAAITRNAGTELLRFPKIYSALESSIHTINGMYPGSNRKTLEDG